MIYQHPLKIHGLEKDKIMRKKSQGQQNIPVRPHECDKEGRKEIKKKKKKKSEKNLTIFFENKVKISTK